MALAIIKRSPNNCVSKFKVRCFAATSARAGELEQGLQKLRVLHLRMRNAVAIKFGKPQEVFPIEAFGLAQRVLRLHIDGLMFYFGFALRRANLHAQFATGAIFRRHLERVTEGLKLAPTGFGGLKGCWFVAEQSRVIHLRANHGVRANQHALATLDAQILVPYGNFLGDIALFPHRRARGE